MTLRILRAASLGCVCGVLVFLTGSAAGIAEGATAARLNAHAGVPRVGHAKEPEVTTLPATDITEEGARLHGAAVPTKPHALITECRFEYGPTTSYGQTAACEGEVAPAHHYHADVKLGPGEMVHYRFVAAQGKKLGVGSDESFLTPGGFGVEGETAQPEVTDAIVRAVVFPFGSSTECDVEYVDEPAFNASGFSDASRAPCVEALLPASFGPKGVTAKLYGLQRDTTYRYRFIARHSSGVTATGPEETFATAGISEFAVHAFDQEGQPITQAGAHPYKLVTNLEFPTGLDANGLIAKERERTIKGEWETVDANPKDVSVALPPGLVGNPSAAARCSEALLTANECPRDSQIGAVQVRLTGEVRRQGLFNLAPPPGYPAEFGFHYGEQALGLILFSVRTGGDYGITGSSLNITARGPFKGLTVEVWGVPADPSHNHELQCPGETKILGDTSCAIEAPLVALLTMPTSCSGPQTATASVDFWQAPGEFSEASSTLPAETGCELLPFGPSISIAPTETLADSPTGLDTEVTMPDSESSSGVAESALKTTVVTLPAGLSLSPSGANGLQACSQEAFGLHDAEKPACPGASRIGTVVIKTPLLPNALEGSVYVAEEDENPFGSVLAIYLAAEGEGALVKLAGHVAANPQTGQLSTTFSETPQLPFSSLKLDLWSGPRAALVTPEACGVYTSEASFQAWAGLAPVISSSPFQVTEGCTTTFSPSFTAGTTAGQAGAYAPFVLSFSRDDSEQEPSGLTVSMPPGLLANLSSVPECPEASAAAGDCPEESRIGSVQTTAGPGPDPLVDRGSAYLTGPYNGGPFGIAVEVPAVAGPFNLGSVVVRSAIHIDPADAHVTVTSDPFPSILDVTGSDGQTDGFPVHLRSVTVTIDRPSFTLNPTNCNPMAVTAQLTSTKGAVASLSSHFQVTGCQTLTFKPSLTATVDGQASKADGTGLEVKITSPGVGAANIRKVELRLPEALPSRDSTLNKACPASVFEANPAGCSGESVIGTGTVHTPLLKNPLAGPAYLVSHGGAAFPDIEFVLQGEGITLILDGKTQIKNGITYSRFETAPDAPFTTFETSLPAGPHSILGAYASKANPYDLCATQLTMPTTITAQDGAVTEQDTQITPEGCGGVLASKTTTPSRADKLSSALKSCRREYRHSKRKRDSCETRARKRYTARKASHHGSKHRHRRA